MHVSYDTNYLYYIATFAHYAINDTARWVRKSTLLDIGNGVG